MPFTVDQTELILKTGIPPMTQDLIKSQYASAEILPLPVGISIPSSVSQLRSSILSRSGSIEGSEYPMPNRIYSGSKGIPSNKNSRHSYVMHKDVTVSSPNISGKGGGLQASRR